MENCDLKDECAMEIDDAAFNLALKVDKQHIGDVTIKEINIGKSNKSILDQSDISQAENVAQNLPDMMIKKENTHNQIENLKLTQNETDDINRNLGVNKNENLDMQEPLKVIDPSMLTDTQDNNFQIKNDLKIITEQINDTVSPLTPDCILANATSIVNLDNASSTISPTNNMSSNSFILNVNKGQNSESVLNSIDSSVDNLNQSNITDKTNFKVNIQNMVTNSDANIVNLKSNTIASICNSNSLNMNNSVENVTTTIECKSLVKTSLNPNIVIPCEVQTFSGNSELRMCHENEIHKSAEIVNKVDYYKESTSVIENAGNIKFHNPINICNTSKDDSKLNEMSELTDTSKKTLITNLLDPNKKMLESDLLESINILNTEFAIIPSAVRIASPKLLPVDQLQTNDISIKTNEIITSTTNYVEKPNIKTPSPVLSDESSLANNIKLATNVPLSLSQEIPDFVQSDANVCSQCSTESQANSLNSNEVFPAVTEMPVDSAAPIHTKNQEENLQNLNLSQVTSDTSKPNISVFVNENDLQSQSISKPLTDIVTPINLDQLCTNSSSKSISSPKLEISSNLSERTVTNEIQDQSICKPLTHIANPVSLDQLCTNSSCKSVPSPELEIYSNLSEPAISSNKQESAFNLYEQDSLEDELQKPISTITVTNEIQDQSISKALGDIVTPVNLDQLFTDSTSKSIPPLELEMSSNLSETITNEIQCQSISKSLTDNVVESNSSPELEKSSILSESTITPDFTENKQGSAFNLYEQDSLDGELEKSISITTEQFQTNDILINEQESNNVINPTNNNSNNLDIKTTTSILESTKFIETSIPLSLSQESPNCVQSNTNTSTKMLADLHHSIESQSSTLNSNEALPAVPQFPIDIPKNAIQPGSQEENKQNLNLTQLVTSEDVLKSNTSVSANTNELQYQSLSKPLIDTTTMIKLDEVSPHSSSKSILPLEVVKTSSSSEITITPGFIENVKESNFDSCERDSLEDGFETFIVDKTPTNIDQTTDPTSKLEENSDFEMHSTTDELQSINASKFEGKNDFEKYSITNDLQGPTSTKLEEKSNFQKHSIADELQSLNSSKFEGENDFEKHSITNDLQGPTSSKLEGESNFEKHAIINELQSTSKFVEKRDFKKHSITEEFQSSASSNFEEKGNFENRSITGELQSQSICQPLTDTEMSINLDQLKPSLVSNSSEANLPIELERTSSSSEIVITPDFAENQQKLDVNLCKQDLLHDVSGKSVLSNVDNILTKIDQILDRSSTSKLEEIEFEKSSNPEIVKAIFEKNNAQMELEEDKLDVSNELFSKTKIVSEQVDSHEVSESDVLDFTSNTELVANESQNSNVLKNQKDLKLEQVKVSDTKILESDILDFTSNTELVANESQNLNILKNQKDLKMEQVNVSDTKILKNDNVLQKDFKLEQIEISDSNTLKNNKALQKNLNLEQVEISNILKNDDAFKKDLNLERVEISNSNTMKNKVVLENNLKLEQTEILDSNILKNDDVFKEDLNLEVEISDSKTIKNKVILKNNLKLEQAEISDSNNFKNDEVLQKNLKLEPVKISNSNILKNEDVLQKDLKFQQVEISDLNILKKDEVLQKGLKLEQVEISDKLESNLNKSAAIISSNLNAPDDPGNKTFNIANKNENEANNKLTDLGNSCSSLNDINVKEDVLTGTIIENLNVRKSVEENIDIKISKECLSVTDDAEAKIILSEIIDTENMEFISNETLNLNNINVEANNSSVIAECSSESNITNNTFEENPTKQKSDVYISGLIGEIVEDSVEKGEIKDVNKFDCQLRFDKSFERKISVNEKANSMKLLSGSLTNVGRVSPKRADLPQIHKPASPDCTVNLKNFQSSKPKEAAMLPHSPKITIKAVSRKSDKFTSQDDSANTGNKSLLSSAKKFMESFNVVSPNKNQEDSFSKSAKNIVTDNQLVMEDHNPLKKTKSDSNHNKTKKNEEAETVLKAEEFRGSKNSCENKENINFSIFSKSSAKPSGRKDTLFRLFDPLYDSSSSIRESPQLSINLPQLDSITDKANMDDAIDEKMRLEQQLNDLKLELNQLQQERTTLQLELHQKEEVILKIQGETQKIGNQYKHEIKELHNKLNAINERNNNEEMKLLKEEISKLKDRDTSLTEQNSKLLEQISSLESTVLHFETTLDRVIKESEKVRGDHDNTKKHLATLEMSFSDVHAKYERTKEIVVAYKNNEEVLTDKLEKSEEIARRYEERYDTLKAHAKAQIDKANKELSAVKEKHQLELNKMTALLRRLEIKNGSIQQALDQKTKECVELAALLDEMAGSVPQ